METPDNRAQAQLTTQAYWGDVRREGGFVRGFELFDDIAKHLPAGGGRSFFEIGCAPGGILAEFCARLDYEAHGIDYATPAEVIEASLRKEGVEVGAVYRDDFLSWVPRDRYDIVASFGFIEHFRNAEEIADRHFRMVRPGGIVIIEMPNFALGQKVLHWMFDRENLKRHNTAIMNPRFLKEVGRRNKAQILEISYAGGQYHFWREDDKPLSWLAQRLMWRIDKYLRSWSRARPRAGSNPYFSPYIFAVYKAGEDVAD